MKATVSEEGRVTIPTGVCDELGIQPADVLEFGVEEGRLVASKREAVDPFAAAFGSLALPGSTDDLTEEIRRGIG